MREPIHIGACGQHSNSTDMRSYSTISWVLAIVAMVAGGCSTAPSATPRESTGVYSFWPQFPSEPRIQFLTSYQYSDDVQPARSGLDEIIYGKERQVLPINKPYGVEMRNGKIYVCDTRNAALIVLDLVKQQTRVIGTSGSARFQSPTDVAVASDGIIYVSDASRGVIFAFDGDERHVSTFGFEGFRPVGLAVYKDELLVCDFAAQQVAVLDRLTGEKRRAFGSPGDQDGQFVRPLGIAVDQDGNAYVTDVIRCRIQKFSPEGELLLAFGTIGDAVGSFVRPKLIDVDRDGNIYVVDAAFANVQLFNDKGELLMFFGIAGSHPGNMLLPAGICVDTGDLELFRDLVHPAFNPQHLLLVTNQFGTNKVSVYAFGKLHEGKTPQDIVGARAPMPTGMQEGVQIDPLTGLPATPVLDPGDAPEDAPEGPPETQSDVDD